MFTRVFELRRVQELPITRQKAWSFFSNPLNLPKITPPNLRFRPLNLDFTRAYAGLILNYKVSPLLGIPLRWTTEIKHVEEGVRFVDEQRFGPYKFWHHEHFFEDVPGGTRMHDIVNYALYGGPLAPLINVLVVQHQLAEIFKFREAQLESIFAADRS